MKNDDDLTAMIICVPVEWEHTKDSILLMGDCGHEVWVAPAGQRVLEEHGETGAARCITCAVPVMKESGIKPEAAPGVLADVERHSGGWERAKMEATLRQWGVTTNG